MDYDSLEWFIRKEMSMTHIYQPIMIRTLLQSEDGRATKENIARQFLGMNESQINYYKAIVGRYPQQVLTKRNVVSYNPKIQEYALLLETVTKNQRNKLIELCNLRLHEFIDKDPAIRRYRELDRRSIYGSVRYDILAKSKGICAACGATSSQTLLHVDHIVPINRKGKDHPDNMQVLCYKCNTQKGDRDETDFLLWHKRLQFRKSGCRMCVHGEHIFENNLAYCVLAEFNMPSLVIPKRHTNSFMSLIPAERNLCLALVDRLIQHLKEQDRAIRHFDVVLDVPANHYAIRLIPKTTME